MQKCVMGEKCDCRYNSVDGCRYEPRVEGCPPVCVEYDQRKQYNPVVFAEKMVVSREAWKAKRALENYRGGAAGENI
ncbi:hypothetical protein SOV_17220 [Sporomusa ovata DSM 2662]|uniref:Uncharacterized protein n=1 Tax=Sporomusa ovata TaxID=2378 RepID=A0A0U1KWS1_9FIRM|nr:hypothetical protein [Sporomusa ovata]EQB29322.1 hypothetical protein SOV_1c10550 [Sporomusa ovata DSM 2662]CQR71363.1 hypothetical protein SpAn4DRAFT_3868 [Sporomusa ovata]